jgi:hypothetical protein
MPYIKELGDLGDRMMQGLPYGQGGAITGASNFNTFSSNSVSQNYNKFDTFTNKNGLASDNTQKKSGVSYDSQNPWDYVRDVENIKYKVTPDEVICGMDYEMKKMVLKDRQTARINVVKNLKKDPKYYSKLHMLGVYPDEKSEAIMEIMAHLKARRYALKRNEYF